MLGTGARLSTHLLVTCPLSLLACRAPTGHEAPATLSSSPWRLTLGTVGCRVAGAEGVGAARPPWSGAESWLLQAPLRAGCCAQGVHGMHICMSVPSFIGYTGMLPCPVPARDGRSCWGQSCGTHLVVVLLGGFCSPCRARGPGQGHPCLPHASSEQLWARLCPTFTEGVRGQLWFAQVDLRLMAALCTPPLAGGVPAMLLPPGEHPDGPPQLQAPAPAAGSSTRCCHMLLPWK